MILTTVQGIIKVEGRVTVIGNNRAISTSKIRKMTAIRKKRREKGIRADDLGSNPHSNGDLFSRSRIVFFDKSDAKSMAPSVITVVSREAVISI